MVIKKNTNGRPVSGDTTQKEEMADELMPRIVSSRQEAERLGGFCLLMKREVMAKISQQDSAAGLGLFAVSGTQKALGHGLGPVMAPLLGMLTGIGGGMLRDLLVLEIPAVLHSDLYAVAALAGAIVVVVGHVLSVPPAVAATAGALCCFGLRTGAIWRNWHLPTAES